MDATSSDKSSGLDENLLKAAREAAAIREAVWQKGIPSSDPNNWRQDVCGAWMRYQDYGNRDSEYGWEIDHIVSIDQGGSDAMDNLRPLQWENNLSKSAGQLICKITAYGQKNGLIERGMG